MSRSKGVVNNSIKSTKYQTVITENFTNDQKSYFLSIKAPLYGFLFSLMNSITNTIASVFLKKAVFFSAVDNGVIRFFLMIVLSSSIAKYNGLQIFSSDNPNKYLLIRGVYSLGVIFYYIALRLISPSDAVSLVNTNIIFLAILSRLFLKEKFSIVHLVALGLVIFGCIFITQPTFLFANNQVKNKNYIL